MSVGSDADAVTSQTHRQLKYESTVPVDAVLRQFDGFPQYGLGERRLRLLLVQFGQNAGRLELDVVEAVYGLGQVPLQREERRV